MFDVLHEHRSMIEELTRRVDALEVTVRKDKNELEARVVDKATQAVGRNLREAVNELDWDHHY